MVVCYDCGKELVLKIDLDSSNFVCKECGARYDFKLDGKTISIGHNSSKIELFIPDLPLNIDLSKSLLYFLYDKGIVYFNSVKEYDREWFIDINLAKKKISSLLQSRKKELENRLEALQTAKPNYSCSYCNAEFSENDALNSNFSCPMCGHPLLLSKPLNSINTLNNEITLIERKLNSLHLI